MTASRIAQFGASVVGSWFAGVTGAFLVWNFIYSIGSRVVTDEIHYQLADSITLYGGVAGAIAGLAVVILLRRPAPGILVGGHALATVTGFFGGSVGCQEGLWAYFGALALLCLVGCQSSRVEHAARQPLTIRVVGPAGASFTGTIKADGVAQEVSGTVPRELQFASNRLSCSFQQGTEPDALRFEVYEGKRLVGSATTTGPRGHCRFRVHKGLMGGRSSWRFAWD